jgi:hypothetical protein
VTDLLRQADNLGRGQRFRKRHWPPDDFWHVVHVRLIDRTDKLRTRAATATAGSGDGASGGTAAATAPDPGSGNLDTDKAGPNHGMAQRTFTPRIYGVRFANGKPTTGRVHFIKNVLRHEWLPVQTAPPA